MYEKLMNEAIKKRNECAQKALEAQRAGDDKSQFAYIATSRYWAGRIDALNDAIKEAKNNG